MAGRRSALLTLGATLFLSCSVVLAGPAAPAMASVTLVPPPAPVGLPSSWLAGLKPVDGNALAGLSAKLSQEYLNRTVGSYTQTAPGAPIGQTGPVTDPAARGRGINRIGSKVGGLGAAISGFGVGWEIGSALCSQFDACSGGQTQWEPGFVPNSDLVTTSSAGWAPEAPGPSYVNHRDTSYGDQGGTMTGTEILWNRTPQFLEPENGADPLILSYRASPTRPAQDVSPYGWDVATIILESYCRDTNTGVVSLRMGGGYFHTYSNEAPASPHPNPAPVTVRCDSPEGFDHIKVTTLSELCIFSWCGDRPRHVVSTVHRWYPPGHELHPAPQETITDPQRKWLTEGQCVRGAQVASTSAASSLFRESDTSVPEWPPAKCEPGWQLVKIVVRKITLDPAKDEKVWEWTRPRPEGEPKHIGEKYPECAGGTCLLVLWRIDVEPDVSCFTDASKCVDWWGVTEPTRSRQWECRYGPYPLALRECAVYKPTFNTRHKTQTQTDTETQTKTEGVPETEPPYADPATETTTPTQTEPAPEGTDPSEGTCPPQAGFLSWINPFWLFDTLKCAVVPTEAGLRAQWEKGNVDWCEPAPGAVICAGKALAAPWAQLGQGDESDCRGGRETVPDIRPGKADPGFYPTEACNEAAAAISGFWLPFSSALVYLGAFTTGARMIAKTIDAEQAVV